METFEKIVRKESLDINTKLFEDVDLYKKIFTNEYSALENETDEFSFCDETSSPRTRFFSA